MDLTEAEDIKKRWQEYTELYKRDISDSGIQDGVSLTQSQTSWNEKTQQWPKYWKRSVFIPIPKKGNAKKRANYHTIALISHGSKVML